MKVVIIGKSGQLANELLAEIPQGVTYLSLGRHDVDITSYRDLSAKIVPFKPNVIINASAYSAVDKAETDIDAAYALNETAVKILATIAKENNGRFYMSLLTLFLTAIVIVLMMLPAALSQ